MGVRINGKNALTFQGYSFEFDPRKGYTLGHSYKGPMSIAASLAFQYSRARIPFSFRQEGPLGTITVLGNTAVEPGQNEIPIDNWQLISNELTKSFDQHPNSLKLDRDLYGALAAIQGVANAYKSSSSTAIVNNQPVSLTNLPSWLAGTNLLATNPTLVAQLFQLLIKGGDHFYTGQPILKHSQTVSDSYAGGGFNYSNIECIYTTTQLLKECASFPYPLPKIYIDGVNVLTAPAEAANQPNYIWGWRKLFPNTHTVANYKSEISTEYWLDLWPVYYYPAAVLA